MQGNRKSKMLLKYWHHSNNNGCGQVLPQSKSAKHTSVLLYAKDITLNNHCNCFSLPNARGVSPPAKIAPERFARMGNIYCLKEIVVFIRMWNGSKMQHTFNSPKP